MRINRKEVRVLFPLSRIFGGMQSTSSYDFYSEF